MVLVDDNSELLAKDYEMHRAVSNTLSRDPTLLFSTPQSYALHIPAAGLYESTTLECRPPLGFGSTLPIAKHLFEPFPSAIYATNRIPPVIESIAIHIRSLYFPVEHPSGPHLCRLYFGHDLHPFPANSLDSSKSGGPRKYFNTNNFPIDLEHYKGLRSAVGANILPHPEDIIKSMGRTLALIHDSSEYDGQDIEFVLGGDGSGNAACWVLDHN